MWHFESQLKKLYLKLRRKRDCQEVSSCIKAIINHLWRCCASSVGNEEMIMEKMARYIEPYSEYSLLGR